MKGTHYARAGVLFQTGWLPRRAAAEALGISARRLDAMEREGLIRSVAIGPGARLYEVARKE